MPHSADSYLALFDTNLSIDDALESVRQRDIKGYRARTIKSGPMLEVEAYPVWDTHNTTRKARQHITREAQQTLNRRNAQKKIVRLINTNFDERDLAITLTFKGRAPTIDEARRQMQNYIRRIKRWRNRNGLEEIKYLYVIEGGTEGSKKRVHLHVVMSGMDRDVAEQLWRRGYANARRLQPDEYGLEAIARYMTKDQGNEKRWAYSKNLKTPTVTESNKKLSKRQVERMVTDFDSAPAAILHQIYKGYEYLDCEIMESKYVSGAYIYARMRKKEENHATKKSAKKTTNTIGGGRARVPV